MLELLTIKSKTQYQQKVCSHKTFIYMRYQSHLEKGTEFTKFRLPRNVPRIHIWNLRVHVLPLNIVWCVHLIKKKKTQNKTNKQKNNPFLCRCEKMQWWLHKTDIRPFHIVMIPGNLTQQQQKKNKSILCDPFYLQHHLKIQ